MLIVCPSCATSYQVASPALGPAGRTVRCFRCGTKWLAAPDDAEAASRAAGTETQAGQDPISASRRHAGGMAAAATRLANQPEPALPVDTDEVERFAAALKEVSAVEPMARDDVAEALEQARMASAVDGPPIVPLEGAGPDPEDIENFAARRAARHAKQRRRMRATQIPALLIALLLTVGALIFWRNDLVRHLPQTASLFSAVGLPVNLRGLDFHDVTIAKETHDGITVLVVEGKITSTSNRPAEVPRLRFAVRDVNGSEIYTWTAQPPRNVLDAGETATFRSRLASPPPEAIDVLVRFFNARDLATGSE